MPDVSDEDRDSERPERKTDSSCRHIKIGQRNRRKGPRDPKTNEGTTSPPCSPGPRGLARHCTPPGGPHPGDGRCQEKGHCSAASGGGVGRRKGAAGRWGAGRGALQIFTAFLRGEHPTLVEAKLLANSSSCCLRRDLVRTLKCLRASR